MGMADRWGVDLSSPHCIIKKTKKSNLYKNNLDPAIQSPECGQHMGVIKTEIVDLS
jgi:hypothetical protein